MNHPCGNGQRKRSRGVDGGVYLDVRDAAALLRAYTNLYSEDNERTLAEGRGAPSYDAATRAYTAALIRASR